MPLYGIDVSHWRGDVDWPRVGSSGVAYAFAKVSEGIDFTDPKWSRNRSGMTGLSDFLPGAYHFLRGDADIKDQVAYFLDLAGDVSGLAVALDVERRDDADEQATRAQAAEWVEEFRRVTGGHPVLGYYPQWYWDEMGRGDLSFFDTLWASHYVSGSGTPEELYPKVPADWWDGYGEESVSILQFSSSGSVPGVPPPVDLNAYRGTLAELRALALGG
jgi:GH25 family lysozyme M1 (1,4-beta-N-acetylmuramidase)